MVCAESLERTSATVLASLRYDRAFDQPIQPYNEWHEAASREPLPICPAICPARVRCPADLGTIPRW